MLSLVKQYQKHPSFKSSNLCKLSAFAGSYREVRGALQANRTGRDQKREEGEVREEINDTGLQRITLRNENNFPLAVTIGDFRLELQ